MANFAQLDENNCICNVVVLNNSILLRDDGVEDAALGAAYLRALAGIHTRWVQTSRSGTFRRRFAAIGGYYVPELDRFIDPSPAEGWIYNATDDVWEPPVPRPAALYEPIEEESDVFVPLPNPQPITYWDPYNHEWFTYYAETVQTPDSLRPADPNNP